jgi:hypothetical protein
MRSASGAVSTGGLLVRSRSACRGVSRTEGEEMNPVKLAAIVLIAAGALGLAYGGFSYTKETHEAKLGPIELSVSEKQTVNVPVWAGVGAIVIGGVLLLAGGKKG